MAASKSLAAPLPEGERPAWVLLVPFLAFAFLVRSWFAWDPVFGGNFVRFSETDAWYHLRLIENLLHNFPFPLTYDPYLKFPGGQNVTVAPGFDVLVAGLALVLGGGAPSAALVDRLAAILPAVLGSLIVVPAYALGRAIYSARSGLFAGALIAVMPGPLFMRSTVGFADHHVAEALFSTIALALFVPAVHGRLEDRWWRAVLAGLALGAYLTMWSGGALFVFALTAGVCLYMVLAHVRGDAEGVRQVAAAFLIAAVIAAGLVVALLPGFAFVGYHLLALAGGVTAVLALGLMSVVMQWRGMARRWYPVAGSLLAAGMAGVLYVAAPGIVSPVVAQVGRLAGRPAFPVGEAMPLLMATPWWPLFLFASFGLALPFALAALVPTVRASIRRPRAGPILLTAWWLVALAAMFGQVRFGYYLAVPVAILAGYQCDRILNRWPRRQDAAFILVVLLVFVPNAQLIRAQATVPARPSAEWHEALTWMRGSTPEPLGDPQAYVASYAGMSESRPYPFPASAYGVLSWWDAGYWIVRIGRRIPNTNPTQAGARDAAEFFLATDASRAMAVLDRLGSRYVIVSSELPAWSDSSSPDRTRYFRAMAAVAGVDDERFMGTFYEARDDGSFVPRLLYYPDYYRTMLTRLYAFGGREAAPGDAVHVAFFSEVTTRSGERRKVLESLQPAGSYADAARAVARQPANARVVGLHPLQTSVPIERLDAFTLVHRSPATDVGIAPPSTGEDAIPAQVLIFEYHPAVTPRD